MGEETNHPSLAADIDALCIAFKDSQYGLTPVVDLATLIACADGVVDEAETEALVHTLRRLLGPLMPEKVARQLIDASLDVVRGAGVEMQASTVGLALAARGMVEQGLALAVAVALASNDVSPEERRAIEIIASAAGYPLVQLNVLIDRVRGAAARTFG
jgi:tellurite resistance protein